MAGLSQAQRGHRDVVAAGLSGLDCGLGDCRGLSGDRWWSDAGWRRQVRENTTITVTVAVWCNISQ